MRSDAKKTTAAKPKRRLSLTIGYNRRTREVEELIKIVEDIETTCLDLDGTGNNKEKDEDEFAKIKNKMLETLSATKEGIRMRHTLQTSQGNTVEVIKMGRTITQNIQTLDNDFQRLKDAFKKQTRMRKQFDETSLDSHFQEMQLLKHQIEECRNLFHNARQYTQQEVMTMTDFRAQMAQQGIEVPKAAMKEWREPSAEEQAAISRWGERDRMFDEQVGEIGEVVDRLGDIAVQIGEKADKQNQMAMDLCRQADEANEELVAVNAKVKGLLKKTGGMNFFLKLFLTLTMLGLMGWLGSLINDRLHLGF